MNKWFKFYGAEYLADPKIDTLTPAERSCWLTLLCLASVSNDNGKITFLSKTNLLIRSGIHPKDDEWQKTLGVLEKLQKLSMITLDNEVITLINFQKRQEINLTPYERVKRHRQKKRLDNEKITSDKIRLDKNRIDKIKEENPVKTF